MIRPLGITSRLRIIPRLPTNGTAYARARVAWAAARRHDFDGIIDNIMKPNPMWYAFGLWRAR